MGMYLKARVLRHLLVTATALGGLATAPYAVAQAARTFDIPGQPLGAALSQYGDQAGVQVSVDVALANGRRSGPVRGQYSPADALNRLLAGTGLVARWAGNGVTVEAPASAEADGAIQLGTIRVEGGTGGNPAGVGRNGDAFADRDGADRPYRTAGASSHISAETIDRFRGTSTADIFKSTPGVISASARNGTALDVNIRGLQGQNRVKVAIDGTQQSTSTWRGYQGVDDRTYIDPDLIGGIDIAKGPGTGAEAAGVIGGVVSIRTLNARDILREGQDEGFRLKVSVADNAIDPSGVNAMTQKTGKSKLKDAENGGLSLAYARIGERFDFVIALARRERGNHVAGQKGDATYVYNKVTFPLSFTKPNEEVFNTAEDTISGLTKATFRWGEGHNLELGYTYYEGEFGEVIPSVIFTQDTVFRQVSLTKAKTDTYTARYRWKIDDRNDVRANLWFSNVDAVTRSVGPAFYLPPFITPQSRPPADDPRPSVTHTLGGDVSNTSRFANGWGAFTVAYGASWLREDTDGKPYRSRIYANEIGALMQPAIGSRTVFSLFSSGEWRVKDWLTLNAGLRRDGYRIAEKGKGNVIGTYAGKDGSRINPSLSVTVSPLEGLQVYALYSEGVRPPSLREVIGSDSLLYPNPNLREEVAKNRAIGVNYLKDGLFFSKDKLRLKLEGFDNVYDDYISRVSAIGLPTNAVFTVTNLDKAQFRGVELSGGYDAGTVFAEWAATRYTDFEFCRTKATCASEILMSDYALNHMPPETTVSVTLGARLFKERLTFGVRGNDVGKRLTPISTERQRTGYWLPYTVYDAFVTWKATDRLTLDLRGENLTDQYYVDALDGWTPSPGRTVRLNLTASF